MISILIPTYNYDVRPLASEILGQIKTLNIQYELIVLDDASPNQDIKTNNKTIASHPNCLFIENRTNKGRTASRQALAQTSKYNWLLFLDADVFPKSKHFIENFKLKNLSTDVVFGGVTYEEAQPEENKILRWKYGKAREAKPSSIRENIPYLSIISGSLLIKKEIFLSANNFLNNAYGVDVLLAQNLRNMNAQVLHISNPVIHYGLESSEVFIAKTMQGLQTLHQFEIDKKISLNYRPIQKAFLKLKKFALISFYITLLRPLEKVILKNLKSPNPSLFLFDIYKLLVFARLKQQSTQA